MFFQNVSLPMKKGKASPEIHNQDRRHICSTRSGNFYWRCPTWTSGNYSYNTCRVLVMQNLSRALICTFTFSGNLWKIFLKKHWFQKSYITSSTSATWNTTATHHSRFETLTALLVRSEKTLYFLQFHIKDCGDVCETAQWALLTTSTPP